MFLRVDLGSFIKIWKNCVVVGVVIMFGPEIKDMIESKVKDVGGKVQGFDM